METEISSIGHAYILSLQGPPSHSRGLARSSRSDGGGQDARRYGSAYGIQQSRA